MLKISSDNRISKSSKPAQINARIDAELKTRGDASFAKAGISTTAAIRALWQKAVDLTDDPAALRIIIYPEEANERGSDSEAERMKRLKTIEEGARIFENALETMGLKFDQALLSGLSDDDLLEREYTEHYAYDRQAGDEWET